MGVLFSSSLRFLAIFAGACLFCIAALTTVDVTVRWFRGVPITGVFEIAQIMLLLMTCFALPLLHYQRRELSVDIFRAQARGGLKWFMEALDIIAGLLFFALLTWTAWVDFSTAFARGFRAQGLLRIPTAIPLGIVTIGAALVFVVLLARTLELRKTTSGKSDG